MATTNNSSDDPKSDVAATADSTASSQVAGAASDTSKATSTAKSASSQAVSAASETSKVTSAAKSTASQATSTVSSDAPTAKDAPTPVPDDGGYIVQQGDDIATVATVHGVSVGWVKFVNNMVSNVLKVGRTIYFDLRG